MLVAYTVWATAQIGKHWIARRHYEARSKQLWDMNMQAILEDSTP